MTDPIADMLTRIRNALAVNKAEVSIPHSNLKETILAQLLKLGFIVGVKTEGELTTKKLVVTLRSESLDQDNVCTQSLELSLRLKMGEASCLFQPLGALFQMRKLENKSWVVS